MLSQTRRALEDFDNQHDFERMAADILNGLGYQLVEPLAPRGGPDGGRDIIFRIGDAAGVALVTLEKNIQDKFRRDLEKQPKAEGVLALFCNVDVSPSIKAKFAKAATAKGYTIEVFDLERLRSMLDSALKDVRRRYLHMDDQVVEVGQPILRVGFDSADPYELSILQEVTISPTWPADRNHSNAVTLTVSTLNLGNKTARDLLWTFVFDGFPEQGHVLSPYGEPMYPVIQPGSAGDADPLKIVHDPKGWVRMVSRLPYLHPGTEQEYGFTIFVPKGQRSILLMVLVSATDVPLEQIDLTANVDEVHQ